MAALRTAFRAGSGLRSLLGRRAEEEEMRRGAVGPALRGAAEAAFDPVRPAEGFSSLRGALLAREQARGPDPDPRMGLSAAQRAFMERGRIRGLGSVEAREGREAAALAPLQRAERERAAGEQARAQRGAGVLAAALPEQIRADAARDVAEAQRRGVFQQVHGVIRQAQITGEHNLSVEETHQVGELLKKEIEANSNNQIARTNFAATQLTAETQRALGRMEAELRQMEAQRAAMTASQKARHDRMKAAYANTTALAKVKAGNALPPFDEEDPDPNFTKEKWADFNDTLDKLLEASIKMHSGDAQEGVAAPEPAPEARGLPARAGAQRGDEDPKAKINRLQRMKAAVQLEIDKMKLSRPAQ